MGETTGWEIGNDLRSTCDASTRKLNHLQGRWSFKKTHARRTRTHKTWRKGKTRAGNRKMEIGIKMQVRSNSQGWKGGTTKSYTSKTSNYSISSKSSWLVEVLEWNQRGNWKISSISSVKVLLVLKVLL